MPMNWNSQGLPPRSYVCSYCDRHVGPAQGWAASVPGQPSQAYLYICSFCNSPTFFDFRGTQYPGAPFGNSVAGVPKEVGALYVEARQCMTVNSFTSAVLTCRKLLMHIAVEKGAAQGKSFLEYVQYLSGKGYIPPDGKGWVDYIRTKGNEANHEIKIMSSTDAGDLITFSEMLLKFVYEFPGKIQPPPPASNP